MKRKIFFFSVIGLFFLVEASRMKPHRMSFNKLRPYVPDTGTFFSVIFNKINDCFLRGFFCNTCLCDEPKDETNEENYIVVDK